MKNNSKKTETEPNISLPLNMTGKPNHIRLNLVLSIFLVLAALAGNQWLIAGFLPAETTIGIVPLAFLWIAEITMIIIGVCIFLNRVKIQLKHYLFSLPLLLLFFGFTVLADIALGLAGLPSELNPKVAHPPFCKKTWQSIYDFEYQFSTNSKGLRYQEIPLQKESPDQKRIFVVGDSFTEGIGVEQEQTFCRLLELAFNPDDPSNPQKVRFINGGLGGTGPEHYMQVLCGVGLQYNIDAVLICIYANDITDTTDSPTFVPAIAQTPKPDGLSGLLHFFFPRMHTLTRKIERGFTEKKYYSQKKNVVKTVVREARKRNIPEQRITDWLASLPMGLVEAANADQFNASLLSSSLLKKDYWPVSLDVESPVAQQKWQNMKSILNFMVNKCRQSGIEVAAVYIPSHLQYDSDSYSPRRIAIRLGTVVRREWLTETSRSEQLLQAWASEEKIAFLDLTQTFRTAKQMYNQNINFKFDSHWTPLGHEIAARAISVWLEEIGFCGLKKTRAAQR